MITTTLGNDALVQKHTDAGLFGSDVMATNFLYWKVTPVKKEDTVVGTQLLLISKMKPNGWVPDMLLPRIQQAQAQSVDCVIEAVTKRKAAK